MSGIHEVFRSNVSQAALSALSPQIMIETNESNREGRIGVAASYVISCQQPVRVSM